MPSTFYRFTCNTEQDIDLIQWLDSFPSRERTVVVKRALRLFIRDTQSTTADKLERLEDTLAKVLREVVSMKREGVSVQNNEPRVTEELTETDLEEITRNISSIMD